MAGGGRGLQYHAAVWMFPTENGRISPAPRSLFGERRAASMAAAAFTVSSPLRARYRSSGGPDAQVAEQRLRFGGRYLGADLGAEPPLLDRSSGAQVGVQSTKVSDTQVSQPDTGERRRAPVTIPRWRPAAGARRSEPPGEVLADRVLGRHRCPGPPGTSQLVPHGNGIGLGATNAAARLDRRPTRRVSVTGARTRYRSRPICWMLPSPCPAFCTLVAMCHGPSVACPPPIVVG